ncbi:MAG: hypothetical protein R3244_11685 [Thermoanaerobaculia bacterium]|nr:hypothetical protein [Thermoanaerobaculia bacterium]
MILELGDDGQYLLFARAVPRDDLRHAEPGPISYHELLGVIRGPGNGLGDIYYVELAALRPEWRR